MTDNVKVHQSSNPADPDVATDEISGKHYQKIKIGWGPDGTWNETEDTAGKRIPVKDPVTSTPASSSDEGNEANTDEEGAAPAAGLRYMGFSARETTETARAVFSIHRGTANGDPLIETVSLGVGESAREWYGPEGIEAAAGIFLQRVSGTAHVVIRSKVVTP